MKQITRDEAESLFLTSNVISSNIEHNQKEMRICLTLANDCSFVVLYDLLAREKKYFVLNPTT